ncbi:MAG TPA: DUF3187 family protein [Woeseiaceae bacterium]|nr:DUF3187 family protein [Woeseiaceae bacterium]
MTIARTIIALPLLLISVSADAAGVDGFALRNQHPFLHVYGLPALQGAVLADPGKSHYGATFAVVNHAEQKDTETESIVLDGESYFVDFNLRRRIHERLEIGVDVPLVRHSKGALDDMIYNWHDFWGISNSKRGGPRNQLDHTYETNGFVQQQIMTSSSGIGDVQLSAAVPVVSAAEGSTRRVTMRFSVKLPTGDPDDVHGSGAADAALGLYAEDATQLFGREFAYLGFAGVLALGDGDILPEQQKSAVPYGGLAATWHATASFGISAQLQAQGAYIDSDLDELGGSSIQLAVGGIYRLTRHGVSLRFALVEDVISDATPDFALYFGVHVAGDR